MIVKIIMLVKVIRSWLSVNQKEMKQFDRIQGWWHPSSPMHVLYQYNYQRVDFVKRVIESDKKKRNCFEVCKIIDVGCGAGFLATSLARLGADVIGLDPNSNSYR